MKILLLFGIFPSSIYDEIIQSSIGVIQYAADALQKSFVEGFASLFKEDVEILNLPYLGSYPLRYKYLFTPSLDFEYIPQGGGRIIGRNVSFCNLTGYKMYSRYLAAKKGILAWCEKNVGNDKTVFVYAIHTPFIKACVEVKKKYKNLKIVLIVPDLPDYMRGKDSLLYDFFNKRNQHILDKLYPQIDSFVLLSQYMRERLPVDNKPWTVIEGIFNNISDDVSLTVNTKRNHYKQIFYSGTLAKRYGIMNLVQAFMSLSDPTYRLLICGDGDSKEDIIDCSQKDCRINYLGQLSRESVLKIQRASDLLVNPRTPEGEFTKYSFPSKTMEYLASGVPTLIYKLPGIPDEYYNYCFTIDSLLINDLANKIEEIFQLNEAFVREKSMEARNFILTEKNPIAQCHKILDIIK